jgi:hypothetical protein
LNFVRATLAQLYNNLIPVLSSDEISKKIVPALATLGADPDKIVRIYIIRAYGNLAVNVDDPFVLEKVGTQLSTFFEDDRHSTRIELAKIFIQMIPTVSPKFRDHCIFMIHFLTLFFPVILPRLTQLTSKLVSATANATEQKDLAKLLFECFRALNGTVTELEPVQEFLNGLRSLSESKLLDSTYKTMMDSMTADMEQLVYKLTDHPQDKQTKPQANFGLWGGFDFKKFTGPAPPNPK